MRPMVTEQDRGMALRRASSWGFAGGFGLILAGFVALAAPFSGALAAAMMLGWVAIVAGVLDLFEAWRVRSEGGAFWRFAMGAAYVAVGVWVLRNPAQSVVGLALALGIGLLIRGGALGFLALDRRPGSLWGIKLFDAVMSVLCGVLVLAAWPRASILFLGMYVGASLIISGIDRLVISMMGRRHLPPSRMTLHV